MQDLTKILFVVFFYSAVFPFGFVMGFIIITMQYITDRFSLMRIWGWNPLLGSELANFSRKYMVTGALLTFAIICSYTFSQFPYDNVCDPDRSDRVAIPGDGTFFNVRYEYGDKDLVPSSPNPGQIFVKQQTQSVYWYVAYCCFLSISLLCQIFLTSPPSLPSPPVQRPDLAVSGSKRRSIRVELCTFLPFLLNVIIVLCSCSFIATMTGFRFPLRRESKVTA